MDLKKLKSVKISQSILDFKKAGKKIGDFWSRYYQVVFIIFLLLSAAAGVCYWYQALYHSGWSEERKQEYSLVQDRGINLKEDEFKKTLDLISDRKKKHDSPYVEAKDIFKSYE